MKQKFGAVDFAVGRLIKRPSLMDVLKINGLFDIVVRDKFGRIKDVERCPNIVTDEGLDAILDIMLHADTQITAWFVLIVETDTAEAAGMTYAVPVFTESTAYDEATRPAYVEAAASGQSITNSASPADFTINATKTIYGAALVGGGTDADTKGNTAGGGTLLCYSKFGASKAVEDDDTLQVTYTISAADA